MPCIPTKTADAALAAADRQQITLPGQDTAAVLVADLATGLLALRRQIRDMDKAIEATFANHPQAQVMRSLPGMGPLAAAEFTVAEDRSVGPPDVRRNDQG